MIKWLLKKYRDNKSKISNQKCIIFPIIPKESLKNNIVYVSAQFKPRSITIRSSVKMITLTEATWNEKLQGFITSSDETYTYEEFNPISEKNIASNMQYDILSYNPTTVNELDLEELRKITYEVGDDTTIESDDVWEKLVDYFDKRGLSD